jgi:hypothetical protein
MKWDSQTGYTRYVTAETNIKAFLGISQLDNYIDSENLLFPYVTYILEYVNNKLITLGIDTDIKQKINEVYRIFEQGSEKIIHEETMNLVREIGISTEESDEIPFSRDRFVFSWTNLLSTLCLRLKFQYAHLFKQESDGECCHCGTRGQTTKDFESWTSRVYPDDEEYDRTNYYRTNTAWGTHKIEYCACKRRPSEGGNL